MSFTVVIPARYASTRLPGKPLLDIAGKPMIQHVYERACESAAQRVIIATDHEGVAEAARNFGAEVCMTAPTHVSGTDRLQEVVSTLGFGDDEIVVNVQGDEPLIPPQVINQVAANLAQQSLASIATLSEAITSIEVLKAATAVKVVTNAEGHALYFSRAPIPWPRDAFADNPDVLPAGVNYQRHIGIYAYRVKLLNDFVTWSPSELELTESLEQLRAMHYGAVIHVAEAALAPPPGVDTEADLDLVRSIVNAQSVQ